MKSSWINNLMPLVIYYLMQGFASNFKHQHQVGNRLQMYDRSMKMCCSHVDTPTHNFTLSWIERKIKFNIPDGLENNQDPILQNTFVFVLENLF